MKFLTFVQENQQRPGVETDRGILDIIAAGQKAGIDYPESTDQIIACGDGAVKQVQRLIEASADWNELWLDPANVTWGPCVTNPGKIICVGLNYQKHAEESNMPIPEYPVLFNKFNNTLAAHQMDIPLPNESNEIDYEAELVIVIGKKAKHIKSKAEALDYVFGYCNMNDLSARDLQMRTNQWLLGKTCDYFSPLGPYLVTADEVGNPNDLSIKCIVNGEVKQNSNTSDMIFHCDEIVHYISQYFTLEPGDIISTGTPEGVVFGYPKGKQVWLKPGDDVTIEIEKLGALTNKMVAE